MKCRDCKAYWERTLPLDEIPEITGCICDGYENKKCVEKGCCDRSKEHISELLKRCEQDKKIDDLLELLNMNCECMEYEVYCDLFDAISQLSDMKSYWEAVGYEICKVDYDTWSKVE